MRMLASVVGVLLLLPGGRLEDEARGDAARVDEALMDEAAGQAAGPLVISRGEGRVPLVIPRKEKLVFNVSLDLGILGRLKVGEVAIFSRVDPFHTFGEQLAEGPPLERATVTAIAVGQYAVYSVRDELSTQIMPQDWPRYIYSKVQTGSENRKRELNIGVKDGVPTASYRSDTHCDDCALESHQVSSKLPWRSKHHCKDCDAAKHRVWRKFRTKEIKPGALDMLSATMIARAMVALPESKGIEEVSVLSKLQVWDITLSRGQTKTQEVRAGKFKTVLVMLDAKPPEEEEDKDHKFSGLFGIHGTISMWFDAATGVPILIAGSVPAGPLTLQVRIELASYSGAPEGFAPR